MKVAIVGLLVAFGGYYFAGGSHSILPVIGIFVGIAGLFIYSIGVFKEIAIRRKKTKNVSKDE